MVLGSGLDVLLGAGLCLVCAEGDDQHERHAGEGDDGLSKARLKRVGSRTRPAWRLWSAAACGLWHVGSGMWAVVARGVC